MLNFQEEGRSGVPGGGAISPPGPDSTWTDSELSLSRIDNKLAQFEAKIAKENDDRCAKMEQNFANMLEDCKERILQTFIEKTSATEERHSQILQKLLLASERNEEAFKDIHKKIDQQLSSHSETISTTERTVNSIKKQEKDILHRLDSINDEVKKVRDDQKADKKTIQEILHISKDTLHNSKRSRDDQVDGFKKLGVLMEKMIKRERSRSASHESAKRGRGNSREGSMSSLNRSRTEQEIEKKMTKMEENITVVNSTLTDLKRDMSTVKAGEDQVLSVILKVAELIQSREMDAHAHAPSINIPKIPNSDDDDRSPSPLNPNSRPSRPTFKPLKESKTKKKKKTRNESSSSSNSSPEPLRRSPKADMENAKAMQVIVSTVSSIEERFKETIKSFKTNNKEVKDNSKITLDRVGEMTVGVQVIAENLDSVNDVARKVEILESVSEHVSKLDKKFDKLIALEGIREDLNFIKSNIESKQNSLYRDLSPRVPSRRDDVDDWEVSVNRPNLSLPPPPPPFVPAAPDLQELRNIVKMSMEERFCEVTGLIEDMSDRFSKKIDALPSSRVTDDVPDLRRRMKRLEDSVHGPDSSPLTMSASMIPSSPQAMSDHRASQLERKLSELSPKLDDLYIRVLPVMSEIKATLKRDETMEHNIVREVQSCQHKLESVFEKIEDIAEAQPVISKPVDPRLERDRHYDNDSVIVKMGILEENITKLQGNVQDCVNALIEMRTFSAKQSTVDKIEKTLNQQREDSVFGSDLSGSASENVGRVLRRVETLLDFSRKQEKSMAAFMKNADSDAKTLSQCNTAIQGMKSAVTANGREVLLAINSITDQVRPLEVALEEVRADMSNFGGTLDEIKAQVRNIDQDSDASDNIQHCLEQLSAITNSLKVDGKTVTVEASSKSDLNEVRHVESNTKADFKPILEAINNNDKKLKETLSMSFSSMKELMKKNNNGMGKAINNVLGLLTETVESQKETNAKLENMENTLIPTVKELVPDLKEVILQSGDGYENSTKIENIGLRIQKLHAVITRVKHLLEAGSDDEDDVKRRRKTTSHGESDGELSSLLREVKEKLSDRADVFTRLDCIVEKMEEVRSVPQGKAVGPSLKMGQLEESVSESISRRIEEDLFKNEEKIDRVQELVQEVKNIVGEVGERMITNKSFSNSQADIRQQISSLEKNISHLPDEVSQQIASMEESLCSNVENSVRDVMKIPIDHLTDEVEGISNKLNELKRIVRFDNHDSLSEHDEESDQPATLGSLVGKINEVAEKLSVVHGALENSALSQNGSRDGGDKIGTALVLEELRKKADVTLISSLRKEVSAAVINQSRVLKEQVMFSSFALLFIHFAIFSFLAERDQQS